MEITPMCANCARGNHGGCREFIITTPPFGLAQGGPRCACNCAPDTRKYVRTNYRRKECSDHPGQHSMTQCSNPNCKHLRHWFCPTSKIAENPHGTWHAAYSTPAAAS